MSAERLLLVEDDATTREVLTLLLEADGWRVSAVESGAAALDWVREQERRPEVLLCDLHLPGVHGAELAAALRLLVPEAAVLAMSASGDGEHAAGYDGFLRKPFGPVELRNVLAGLRFAETTGDAGSGEGEGRDDAKLPVIATKTFLQLQRQMGARARDLYAFALTDTESRLRRMERSVEEGDLAAFHTEAHAIKGSAGMIGAERLWEMASAAEVGTNLISLSKKVQEMHLACGQIRLMLETLFPI